MASWHHDPDAILRDELREVFHIIGVRGDVQISVNERLIGWAKRVRLHGAFSFRVSPGLLIRG